VRHSMKSKRCLNDGDNIGIGGLSRCWDLERLVEGRHGIRYPDILVSAFMGRKF